MRKRDTGPTEEAADDAVGYGRPPKATQFQPGKSGNPRGRPKGAKNAATMANLALDQKIPVTEKGVHRRMSVREVAFRRLAEKAVAGDLKTLAFLLTLAAEANSHEAPAATEALSQQDADIIKTFLEGMQRQTREEQ